MLLMAKSCCAGSRMITCNIHLLKNLNYLRCSAEIVFNKTNAEFILSFPIALLLFSKQHEAAVFGLEYKKLPAAKWNGRQDSLV